MRAALAPRTPQVIANPLDGRGKRTSFFALDARTGTQLWKGNVGGQRTAIAMFIDADYLL